MQYEDNPEANLAYLRTLSSPDLQLYVKGYLMACIHMREAFSRGKIEFLNSIFDAEDSRYMAQVHLLDSYEKLIRKKEAKLLSLYPSLYQDPIDPVESL